MKWHFNFFRFAVMCAAFVALAGFMACSDDDSESGPELVLSASTSSLAGGGSVTFTVAFEDRDVTAEAVIKNVTSGSEVQNATWTTNVAGTYEFQAAYDGMLSNVVSVKAESHSESDAFYRHVLLTKFTATWCGPCAQAQRYFEQLKPEESERFQSIFAKNEGAVTAPTASLLFSRELMKRLEIKGIDFAYITLHAGLGNFRDIDVEDLTKHKMDSEQMIVNAEAVNTVNRAKDKGKNVCAVGTTVMRAIESAVSTDGHLKEFEGWTNKFIFPPYEFTVANSMISNFHMPLSTLLMIVAAFGGYEQVMDAYHVALKEGYRFGTYGDAMLILDK